MQELGHLSDQEGVLEVRLEHIGTGMIAIRRDIVALY